MGRIRGTGRSRPPLGVLGVPKWDTGLRDTPLLSCARVRVVDLAVTVEGVEGLGTGEAELAAAVVVVAVALTTSPTPALPPRGIPESSGLAFTLRRRPGLSSRLLAPAPTSTYPQSCPLPSYPRHRGTLIHGRPVPNPITPSPSPSQTLVCWE